MVWHTRAQGPHAGNTPPGPRSQSLPSSVKPACLSAARRQVLF